MVTPGFRRDHHAPAKGGPLDATSPDDQAPPAAIGWLRAMVTGVLIVVIGIGALAYGTNALVTRLTSLDRSQRVGVATASFFIVFAAIAWGLRRLQRSGRI